MEFMEDYIGDEDEDSQLLVDWNHFKCDYHRIDQEDFDLEVTLEKFIEKDKELILKLTEIIEAVKVKRKTFNIAKTTGVSVAGAGTVLSITALCLSPFTAGASLAFLGIPAIVTSVAGGLTSAGANIAEGITSKGFLKDALELQQEQMRLAAELSVFRARTNGIVVQLIKWGWEEEVAINSVLKSIKCGVLSAKASQEEEDILADAKIVDAELENNEDFGKIGDSGENTKIAKGILGVSASVGKVVHNFTPIDAALTAVVFQSSAQTATSATLKATVQGAAVAVGIAFTVVDIVFLVKSWRNDHPLIPQIEEIIKALEEDINDCEKLLESYLLL